MALRGGYQTRNRWDMSENLSLLKQLDFQGDHYNDLLFEVNTIFFLWEAMNEKTATKNYTFPHFVVIFCVQLVCVCGGGVYNRDL